jgi:hypothetical protein
MRTLLSKTIVVEELAALLASQRSISRQRLAAYRRLALAVLDAADFRARAVEVVGLASTQPPAAAA